MSHKKLFLAVLAVGAMMLGGTPRAEATLLLSSISTAHPQTLVVGNLSFEFDTCSGYCSSNIQIIGVPASAATGPGGGIELVPVTGTSIVDPTNYDISLGWYVNTVPATNTINGVTGSAVGVQGTGSGSVGTQVFSGSSGYTANVGTVTTNINGSTTAVTLALLQNTLGFNSDFHVNSGGTTTITNGTV